MALSSIEVVTSFSPEGYALYGRKCVESFLKHWPNETILSLFVEDGVDKYDFSTTYRNRVRVFDLTAETDILEFISDWGWHPRLNHPTDYRLQGVRFCHKVFAMTADCLPKSGIRVWLDADTETTKPIDHEYLKRCLPAENEVCSYLGRTQWHHSETGWLGFNLEGYGWFILKQMLDAYVSGMVTQLEETHDAWVFDQVRKSMAADVWPFRNLSPNAVGLDAWNHSPLGKRMVHYKGNLKLR